MRSESEAVVDISGKEYELGNYVFCVTTSYDSCSTFFGKVVRVGSKAVTVMRFLNSSWAKDSFVKKVLQKPQRDLIITDEMAHEVCPELEFLEIDTGNYTHTDRVGTKYSVGDYIYVSQCYGGTCITTYFAKVVKLNPESISVKRAAEWYHNSKTEVSVLRVPGNHLIVPKEMAICAEPLLDSEE